MNRLTKKKLKPTTIQNILLVAKLVKHSARGADQKRLFTEKWDNELIDAPLVNEAEQHRPRFAGQEQVSQIVKTATGRIQMICIILASSGLRIEETLGLEIRHFDGSSVKVEQSIWNARPYPPKTPAARRTVDLHPDAAKLLRDYVGTRTTGFIFKARTGKPLRATNILRREFHPVLEQLKIPLCGFHAFPPFFQSHAPRPISVSVRPSDFLGRACQETGDGLVRPLCGGPGLSGGQFRRPWASDSSCPRR